MSAELVFAPDHTVSEIRYSWLFDPAYSAYAVLGLSHNQDGSISQEALRKASIINTDAFAEAHFFTFVSEGTSNVGLAGASGYALDFDGGRLTMSFRLHLQDHVSVNQALIVRIYDPTFFVSLTLAGRENAFSAANLPNGCSLQVSRPESLVDAQRAIPDEIFLAMRGNTTYGEKYAVEAKVTCSGSQ